jgi:ferredoxin-NADP reductase
MTMKHYRIKNLRKGEDVLYLTLQPRNSIDRLHYQAGQYAAIGFRGNNGRRSPMRCFSIVSSSTHPDELKFAVRVEGNFTTSLAGLKIGDKVFVQGPFGDFIINKNHDRNIVMIAGGIGITPLMSMIRTWCLTGSSIPITLLYSYRSRHNIPFYDELKRLAKQNPKFKVIIFVTDKATAPNAPHLLSGRMSERHLQAVVSGSYAGSSYFLCGPIGFLQNVRTMLRTMGVDEHRLITESFTQSSKIMTKSGYSVQKLTYVFAGSILLIGIVGISYLDLSRYVPRYTQAANYAHATNPSLNASTGTSNNTSAVTPTPKPTTSDESTPQTQQSYQAPVTSVS